MLMLCLLQRFIYHAGMLTLEFWLAFTLHCVKSVRDGSHSGPNFSAFGLNTERYSVSLCIQSECGKMWTRTTPNTNTFYGVKCNQWKKITERDSLNIYKKFPKNIWMKKEWKERMKKPCQVVQTSDELSNSQKALNKGGEGASFTTVVIATKKNLQKCFIST